MWSVFIPALVAERGIGLGLSRSSKLTEGRRWIGFWVAALPFLLLLTLLIVDAATELHYVIDIALYLVIGLASSCPRHGAVARRLATGALCRASLRTLASRGWGRSARRARRASCPSALRSTATRSTRPSIEKPKRTRQLARLADIERDPRVEVVIDQLRRRLVAALVGAAARPRSRRRSGRARTRASRARSTRSTASGRRRARSSSSRSRSGPSGRRLCNE